MIPTTAATAGGYGLGGLLGAGIGRALEAPRQMTVSALGSLLNNMGASDVDLSEGDMTPLFGEGIGASLLGGGANMLMDPLTYLGAIGGTGIGHKLEQMALSRAVSPSQALAAEAALARTKPGIPVPRDMTGNLLRGGDELTNQIAGPWSRAMSAVNDEQRLMGNPMASSTAKYMTPDYLRSQAMLQPDKMINYDVLPLEESLSSLIEKARLSQPTLAEMGGYQNAVPWNGFLGYR